MATPTHPGHEQDATRAPGKGYAPDFVARVYRAAQDAGGPVFAIAGLQGPTISRVVVREQEDTHWYAVNIIVHRSSLFQAVTELREIGGSGVVVMPVSYIFEEEPPRYMAMLQALKK